MEKITKILNGIEDLKKSVKSLVEDIIPDEVLNIFEESNIPFGWVNIIDYKPTIDFLKLLHGGGVIKLKDKANVIYTDNVLNFDLLVEKYANKNIEITHWFHFKDIDSNEKDGNALQLSNQQMVECYNILFPKEENTSEKFKIIEMNEYFNNVKKMNFKHKKLKNLYEFLK